MITDEVLFSHFTCAILHIPEASSTSLAQGSTNADAYDGIHTRPGQVERLRTSSALLQGSTPLPYFGRHTQARFGAIGDHRRCATRTTVRAVDEHDEARNPSSCSNSSCDSLFESQSTSASSIDAVEHTPDTFLESVDDSLTQVSGSGTSFDNPGDTWQQALPELTNSSDSMSEYSFNATACTPQAPLTPYGAIIPVLFNMFQQLALDRAYLGASITSSYWADESISALSDESEDEVSMG